MSRTLFEWQVVYEDNHLLVVNKPPGLATMGAKPGQPSLLEQAKLYVKEKYQKPGNVYLGVVSRLDGVTSGLVVFARTSKAAKRLSAQFQSRSVRKQYLAVVSGRAPAEASWTDRLWKNEKLHRMQVVEANHAAYADAKVAELSIERLGATAHRSLANIRLGTGRKHQIRVQLAERGLPILGDKKYGSTASFRKGIALHAYDLGLVHPTRRQALDFSCFPPDWWPFGHIIRESWGE